MEETSGNVSPLTSEVNLQQFLEMNMRGTFKHSGGSVVMWATLELQDLNNFL